MYTRMLFWLLLPLVVVQGLGVRRRALRFAAPEGATAGQAPSTDDRPPLRLLALGDSIVAGVGAGSADNALAGATGRALAALTGRTVHWQGLGRIGAGIADLHRHLLPALADTAFDCVVISIGVNDITRLRRSGAWARRLARLLDRLRARDPAAIIVMAGMPPLHGFPLLPVPLRGILGMRARSFSRAARHVLAGRPGMAFVPLDFDPQADAFSPDGFHPGPESYAALGRALADALAQELAAATADGSGACRRRD
jgi:lysophospholipase L1-like esterase